MMPMPLKDLSGKRFGRLKVVGRHGKCSLPVKWDCFCDCGNKTIVARKHLVSGSTISCGCYRLENAAKNATIHGHSGRGRSRTYVTWEAIKQRCHNPNANGYEKYGDKGIKVCDLWRKSFQSFLDDMGERPEGMTIDRIDNLKGYNPDNCRWATYVAQGNNRKNNRIIEYLGEKKSVAQWAREYGMSRGVLWHRIYSANLPIEQALTIPVLAKNTQR